MYLLHHWVIDWDKVDNLEQIKEILKNIGLGFERPSEEMKKFCKLVDKQTGEELKLKE